MPWNIGGQVHKGYNVWIYVSKCIPKSHTKINLWFIHFSSLEETFEEK